MDFNPWRRPISINRGARYCKIDVEKTTFGVLMRNSAAGPYPKGMI